MATLKLEIGQCTEGSAKPYFWKVTRNRGGKEETLGTGSCHTADGATYAGVMEARLYDPNFSPCVCSSGRRLVDQTLEMTMSKRFGKARVPDCYCEARFTCGACLRSPPPPIFTPSGPFDQVPFPEEMPMPPPIRYRVTRIDRAASDQVMCLQIVYAASDPFSLCADDQAVDGIERVAVSLVEGGAYFTIPREDVEQL